MSKLKGKLIMWIARDKNGELILSSTKPIRNYDSNCWKVCDTSDCTDWMLFDKSLYPDLSWEDEPIDVEIDTRQSLITRMEILHTNYYQESNKFFDENPGKGFMSFDEYALKTGIMLI